MKAAILSTDSESDFSLLVQVAKKLGLSANVLNDKEIEELGLFLAIEEGRTHKYVDTKKFLKKLKNGGKD